jgi:hypothetical protein
MAAFNRLIPGRRYEGRLNRGQGLEVHAFADATHRTHVVWTTDGLAAALPDLYAADDLASATVLDRDGNPLSGGAALDSRLATLAVCESPLYLRWPAARQPSVAAGAAPLPGLAIHAHGEGRHYYYRDDIWHGMVRAADGRQADRLIQGLHPDRLIAPGRDAALRHARNAIWMVADPRDPGGRLVVKQPVKHHLHKKLLDRLKPSKARRSWNGASELLRRGVETAAPVAWFEARDGRDLTRNWYVCDYVDGQLSVGGLFAAYARGEPSHAGITPAMVYGRLAEFLLRMHNRGLFFRDLSGGNILVRRDDGGHPFQPDRYRPHPHLPGWRPAAPPPRRPHPRLPQAGRARSPGIPGLLPGVPATEDHPGDEDPLHPLRPQGRPQAPAAQDPPLPKSQALIPAAPSPEHGEAQRAPRGQIAPQAPAARWKDGFLPGRPAGNAGGPFRSSPARVGSWR